MTKEYSSEEIEFMKNISAENMTQEEARYYRYLLQNCEDVVNPKHFKLKGSKGKIFQLKMHRNEEVDDIVFEAIVGYASLEGDIKDSSYIHGNITMIQDKIVVEMNVSLLNAIDEHKQYIVFDEFKLKDGKVIRKSFYDYDIDKKYRNQVEIEWKGNKL